MLVIAGGRDYRFTAEDIKRLDEIHAKHKVTEVISGGANGADSYGAQWAKNNGIPVTRFHANWSLHGKAAGPIRNRQMAEHADTVALFPGGRGTASMHAEAVKAGIQIFDFR